MNPCTIVMYHYVREPRGEFAALKGITPQQFEGQLDYLMATFTIISLEEYISGGSLPERPCVLTFDDGVKEHAETIAPILMSRKIPATFFVSSEPLADKRVLDVHKVHALLAKLGSVSLGTAINSALAHDFPDLFSDFEIRDGEKRDPRYRFDDAFTANLKYTTNNLPREARRALLSKLFKDLCGDEDTFVQSFYMTPDELRALDSEYITIGSHSHTHEKMTNQTDAEVVQEVLLSHEILSTILGSAPSLFSYPYGNVANAAVNELRKLGYRGAVTTAVGTNENIIDPFLLERVNTNDLAFS